MNSQSIFALPTSTTASTPNTLRFHPQTVGKRKRKADHEDPNSAVQTDGVDSPDRVQSSEYTAVVTPAERSQRRLAGQPLDQTPPPHPFPHAPSAHRSSIPSISLHERETPANFRTPQSKPHLRLQHFSAMVAVLHRSMINKDYSRAGRALGLILRTEFAGRSIDIRSNGMWGMGAEILLCEKRVTSKTGTTISRAGFEQAKLYYERLMVQHPPHKSWPDVVNTLDFCTAMFSLWIHVTNLEALHLHDLISPLPSDDDDGADADLNLYEAKTWEMNQAKQIADAMDQRMQDNTLAGFNEMIRLRAMVALWVADLMDACTELELEAQAAQDIYEQEQQSLPTNVEHMMIDTPQQPVLPQTKTNEASEHRKRARNLFSKLKM